MATPSAKMSVLACKDFVCVKIAGRANFTYGPDFKTLLTELVRKGCEHFIIDLSDCALMDSTFLGILAGFGLKLNQTDAPDGHGIELRNPNTRIADLKGQVDVTSQKVGMTQAELAQAKSRAESIRKEQLVADQKITEQISTAQKENAAQIGAVATDLGGAKKDIEATRTDLEATKTKLERATGDMGVMSGLIAKNHDDLEELRRKGDRNYYEFSIQKSKTPQRVGPVQIALNKTDQKKSKYTMTVLADDKSIEKKDKTSGEPVQFYVKGSAKLAPYEVVVFDVGKNQITGYLATPKDSGTASK